MHEKRVQKYDYKVVKSGRYLEVYKYDDLQVSINETVDMERKDNDKITINGEIIREREQECTQRAKKQFRRLIEANAGRHETTDKFLTLTFAENVTDRKFAVEEFGKFIYKLKRKYGKFEYLAVTEYQERGAVHFHCILFNFPYIPENELPKLQKLWGFGWIDLKAIRGTFKLTNYLSKYFMKTFEDGRNPKEKRFLRSLGLQKSEEMKALEILDIENLGLPVYQRVFNMQYIGDVEYKKIRLFDNAKDLSINEIIREEEKR